MSKTKTDKPLTIYVVNSSDGSDEEIVTFSTMEKAAAWVNYTIEDDDDWIRDGKTSWVGWNDAKIEIHETIVDEYEK